MQKCLSCFSLVLLVMCQRQDRLGGLGRKALLYNTTKLSTCFCFPTQVSEGFLHNSYHIYKELKDVSDILFPLAVGCVSSPHPSIACSCKG